MQQPSQSTLDHQYLRLRTQVQHSAYYRNCNTHSRIRISQWLRILDTIISNHTWRKNRNNYIKILDLMCQCEVLTEPFSRMPVDNLPKLNKHHINQIIDAIERAVKQQRQILTKTGQHSAMNTDITPQQYWKIVKKQNSHSNIDKYTHSMMDLHKNRYNEESGEFEGRASINNNRVKRQSNQENKSFCSLRTNYQTEPTQLRTPLKNNINNQNNLNSNTILKPLPYFCKNKRLLSEELSMSSINFFQYSQEQSLGLQAEKEVCQYSNPVLKTEPLQGENSQEFDFQAQLSERCPQLLNLPSKSYFGWKKQSNQKKNGCSKAIVKKIDLPVNKRQTPSEQQQKVIQNCNGDNSQQLECAAIELSRSCQIYEPQPELIDLCLTSSEPMQQHSPREHNGLAGIL